MSALPSIRLIAQGSRHVIPIFSLVLPAPKGQSCFYYVCQFFFFFFFFFFPLSSSCFMFSNSFHFHLHFISIPIVVSLSSSAATQVSELVSYLTSNCKTAWSGRIWLDIEGTQYWMSSTSSNQAWYQQLQDACSSSGARCGVYTSANSWNGIFGSSFT